MNWKKMPKFSKRTERHGSQRFSKVLKGSQRFSTSEVYSLHLTFLPQKLGVTTTSVILCATELAVHAQAM